MSDEIRSDPIRSALPVLFPDGGVVEIWALANYQTHSDYFDNHSSLGIS